MTILLIIIHIMVCLFLIAVVLLQSGKGAEIGAAFGGSSQTLFGSRGAATFLSKMTTVAAVVFMLSSLTLAVVTTRGASVLKKVPLTQEQKSIPNTTGPVQGTGVQPLQQPQQQTPQIPQKQLPLTQQKAPAPQAQHKPLSQVPLKQAPQQQQQVPQTAPQTSQQNVPQAPQQSAPQTPQPAPAK